MSAGWSWFIIFVSLGNIAGALWLLWANGRTAMAKRAEEDTGHRWDQDLTELNNPLPRWWLWLFMGSVVWGLGYLVLYPGLGNFTGALGWTQADQHAAEIEAATRAQAPRYARFASMPLTELARDVDAMATARSLFANDCAGCHGSDGRGAPGFPNLTDDDWLYGSEPETLVTTISGGRGGVMPPWQATLGEEGVNEVVAYLLSLQGEAPGSERARAGAQKFATFCVACHGIDARGNRLVGAPNIADGIWLYGGDEASLRQSVAGGRHGQMPAHQGLLGPDRVRLMAAYVLSLSLPQNPQGAQELNSGTADGG
jgi:cytochrome c oxidase cbb3-type subunit 3